MKKNEIEEVIADHFKRIDRYFHKILNGFETEDIHEFRTEIKKLRSFLHLLEMETDDGIPFRIAKKMKTFYGYVGIVRNVQLQLKSVQDYLKNNTYNAHLLYLDKLKKEIEDWEVKIKEFIDSDNNFHKDEKIIIAKAPDKLRKNSIKKFIQYVLYQVQCLLTRREDDEALHGIRKALKDISYNRIFLQHYIATLPAVISKEEETRAAIEILGRFNDKCIALALLQTYYDDSFNEEKKILQQIEHYWQKEKQELIHLIYGKLLLLQLTSNKVNVVAIRDAGFD